MKQNTGSTASNDLIGKKLSPVATAVVIAILFLVVGGFGFRWWTESPTTKKRSADVPVLAEESKIYFIYDKRNTTLQNNSLFTVLDDQEYKTTISDIPARLTTYTKPVSSGRNTSMYSPWQTVSVDNYDSSVPLNKYYFAREPEETPSPKLLSKMDTVINPAIKKAIETQGFTAEETTFGDNSVPFWNAHPIKPVRIIVSVTRRFEHQKCLFSVEAQLQREGELAAPSGAHVYVTVERSASLLNEVSEEEAPKAIQEKVTDIVQNVIKRGTKQY